MACTHTCPATHAGAGEQYRFAWTIDLTWVSPKWQLAGVQAVPKSRDRRNLVDNLVELMEMFLLRYACPRALNA